MKKSIRFKFLTVVVSGMLLVALAVGGVSAIYISKTLNDDSDIITRSAADVGAVSINDLFINIVNSATTMENYVSDRIETRAQIEDEEFRTALIDHMKSALQNIAINTPGLVGYYLRFNPDITTPTSGFFIGSKGSGQEFNEYEPYSLDDWQNQPADVAGWYAETVKNGAPTWIAPYYNASNGLEIVSYVVPFYKDRTLIGVVGVDIELSKITKMVSDIKVHDQGFAFIKDSKGEVVYTPAAQHYMDRLGTHHGFAEEQRVLENGMTLVVHVDYSDIRQESYTLLWAMVLIAIFIVLVFTLITYAITVRIVKPLHHLAESAEHLADGGYEFVADEDVDVEIMAVNNALKKASDKINSYMNYINNLAYRDALTGVKNSAAYNETVVDIERRMRVGEMNRFGLMVCDINMLKSTNDKYGHEFGNRLIVKASKIICTAFKHSPVFRIGGDEFVVILEGDDLDNMQFLVAELDRTCSDSFVDTGKEKISVSIARGLSVFNPDRDTNFDNVFARADHNMYLHKDSIKSSNK